MRRMAASSAAPRKARKASRGSDEAANPGRVLFLVYLGVGVPVDSVIQIFLLSFQDSGDEEPGFIL